MTRSLIKERPRAARNESNRDRAFLLPSTVVRRPECVTPISDRMLCLF
jgi:hypothetical protein